MVTERPEDSSASFGQTDNNAQPSGGQFPPGQAAGQYRGQYPQQFAPGQPWQRQQQRHQPFAGQYQQTLGQPGMPVPGVKPKKRRGWLIAVIAVVVVALAGVGGFWWIATHRGVDESVRFTPFVEDISSTPEVSWTFQLPASEGGVEKGKNLDWADMPGDRVMVWNEDTDNVEFFMLDLVSGEQLWSVDCGSLADGADQDFVTAWDLPGTDTLGVVCGKSFDESLMFFLNRDSGELADTITIEDYQGIFTDNSGNAYLLDEENGEISRIASVTQPHQRLWTLSLEDVLSQVSVDRVGDLRLTENGGYVFIGTKYFMGYLLGSVEDGTTPNWGEYNRVSFLDGIAFVETDESISAFSNEEPLWTKNKDQLATLPESDFNLSVQGNMLVVVETAERVPGVDNIQDASAIFRLDPKTGNVLWTRSFNDAKSYVQVYSNKVMFESYSNDTDQFGLLNENDGSIKYRVPEEGTYLYCGEDALYLLDDSGSGSQLSSYSAESFTPTWTKTFPNGTRVWDIGRFLILVNYDNDTFLGLAAQ